MQKNYTNIFVCSNFYIQIFVILLNLAKYTHFKLSNELSQVSVGHLSPDLYQFLCKINFNKILNFVKKDLSNQRVRMSTFFQCKKSSKLKVSCQSIANFYKLHHENGKLFISNHFKATDYTKKTLYYIMIWMEVSMINCSKICVIKPIKPM